MKDNSVSRSVVLPPALDFSTDVPYMIALGTSHVYGECENEYYLEGKFTQRLAEYLGLRLINVGIPGANNQQLQTAFVELMDLGLIKNKNLKFFLFEPRMYDTSVNIPLEAIIDEKSKGYPRWQSILNDPGFWKEHVHPVYNNSHQTYFKSLVNISSMTYNAKKEEDDYLDYIKNLLPSDFSVKNCGRTIRAYRDYIILDYETIPSFLFNSCNMINLIFGCLEKHTKHAWISFNHFNSINLAILQGRYPKLYESLAMYSISEVLSGYTDMDLFCKCQHLNQNGHRVLFEKIKKPIGKIYYD
jgi:hypothetical protein